MTIITMIFSKTEIKYFIAHIQGYGLIIYKDYSARKLSSTLS